MLFQISYERFLEEIRIESIDDKSKNKLEREDLGDRLAYYLVPFERKQIFVFVVSKKEITAVQRFNLNPLSRPSKRIVDETQLKAISETLKNIEESLFKLPIRERIIEREVTKEE